MNNSIYSSIDTEMLDTTVHGFIHYDQSCKLITINYVKYHF